MNVRISTATGSWRKPFLKHCGGADRSEPGAAELSVPVLGVVAGLLWRQRAGQSGHLDPDGVVQILLTGVDRAGDYQGHAEQTGPVLLRRQEVQLCPHLRARQ